MARKPKLKVGDRVRVAINDGREHGSQAVFRRVGKVKTAPSSSGDVLVTFSRWKGGHGPNKHDWFLMPNKLVRMPA